MNCLVVHYDQSGVEFYFSGQVDVSYHKYGSHNQFNGKSIGVWYVFFYFTSAPNGYRHQYNFIHNVGGVLAESCGMALFVPQTHTHEAGV